MCIRDRIGRYQEGPNQVNKPIFGFNELEKKQVEESVQNQVNQLIEECLRK